MNYQEAIAKAKIQSDIERSQSGRNYGNNEGVWVEVYCDNGDYNLEERGEKICAVEATKFAHHIHRY